MDAIAWFMALPFGVQLVIMFVAAVVFVVGLFVVVTLQEERRGW